MRALAFALALVCIASQARADLDLTAKFVQHGSKVQMDFAGSGLATASGGLAPGGNYEWDLTYGTIALGGASAYPEVGEAILTNETTGLSIPVSGFTWYQTDTFARMRMDFGGSQPVPISAGDLISWSGTILIGGIGQNVWPFEYTPLPFGNTSSGGFGQTLRLPDVNYHGLVAVPEASQFLMFGAVLAAAGAWKWRRG